MSKVLEFPSDTTFKKWLTENSYTKDNNFASVWTEKGKCVAGTVEKHVNGERAWHVVIY